MSRCVVLLPLIAVAVGGCAHPLGRPPASVSAHAPPPPPPAYTVACPDVLAVSFLDHPHADCLAAVDLNGTLDLGVQGRPRVAGLTPADAASAIATAAGTHPGRVRVELADPRAGRLYIRGPERNRERTVAYHGPERASEFLRRVAALTPGCTDWRDVCVVRPNVAAGERTQVFRPDLEAILVDGDRETDILLQPGDTVYVGETRRSSFARLLPVWAKPWYRAAVGLLPETWPWER